MRNCLKIIKKNQNLFSSSKYMVIHKKSMFLQRKATEVMLVHLGQELAMMKVKDWEKHCVIFIISTLIYILI